MAQHSPVPPESPPPLPDDDDGGPPPLPPPEDGPPPLPPPTEIPPWGGDGVEVQQPVAYLPHPSLQYAVPPEQVRSDQGLGSKEINGHI